MSYLFGRKVSPSLPGRQGTGLSSSMANLHGNLGVLAVSKVDNLLEWRNVAVVPDAAVFGADAALGCYGKNFGDDQ